MSEEEKNRELKYKLDMLNHAREIYIQNLNERWLLIRWQMLVYVALFGGIVMLLTAQISWWRCALGIFGAVTLLMLAVRLFHSLEKKMRRLIGSIRDDSIKTIEGDLARMMGCEGEDDSGNKPVNPYKPLECQDNDQYQENDEGQHGSVARVLNKLFAVMYLISLLVLIIPGVKYVLCNWNGFPKFVDWVRDSVE